MPYFIAMTSSMKPCFDYALHYINRFPKTEYELRLQLRKKWYFDEEIEEVMQQLFELNYVNDAEYARLYLSSEVERKGKPLFKIRWKLLQKWVEKWLLDDVIAEHEEDLIEWMKAKISSEIDLLKNRWLDGVSIIQKLQWRWYSFRLIKEVIEEREDAW